MATMLLEREALPTSLSSYFAVPRIKAIPRDGGVFLTAAPDTGVSKQKCISIESAYGLFKDMQGMSTVIEREESDRL